jgi:5'-nucleotidase
MEKKLRIFLDMDGVLADFEKAAQQDIEQNYNGVEPENYRPDHTLDFSKFAVMPGAKEAVQRMIDAGHDVFIASTPPWDNKDAWGQKGVWIDEHFPMLKKKVNLTHRKDLLIGDILIDDTGYRGQIDFEGEWIHFGKSKRKVLTENGWRTRNWGDWKNVMTYLNNKHGI